MASSTALTTICGSMPFSRLRASITLYSSLAIILCHLTRYSFLNGHSFSCAATPTKIVIPTRDLLFLAPAGAIPKLKLRNQIRLLHVGQIDLNLGARFNRFVLLRLLARRQFQTEPAVVECLQASFEMPIPIHRIAGRQFHQAANKALELFRLRQLAIQSRR